MTATVTSHRAYESAVLEGLTSRVQYKVMSCMYSRGKPMTRRMIEEATGLRISTVTPAVFALMSDGKLEVVHEADDPISGHLAEFLAPTSPEPRQGKMELP